MNRNDDILIRPVQLADVESFHGYSQVVAHERRYWGKTEPRTLAELHDWIGAAVQRGTPFLVAMDGQTLVGDAHLVVPRLEGHTHLGALGMGLLPAYRGRGLGLSLLTAVVTAGWSFGLSRIELQAYGSNTLAIALYERFGFRHEGRRRHARFLDGEYDDAVLMSLLRDEVFA
ncbi:GNAT family protein [Niveibacterium sp. SC-1]|uniref:GNAT family N-acetyltransferase n=1 Tax=Niveibacterium sp. SC-1 TaxID=3135646 RepID=UPI00311F9805